MWIKLDDQVSHHPKLIAAGPMASWLWVCGLAYCARYVTNGKVPLASLPLLGSVPRASQSSAAASLVRVGLWDKVEAGWQVHDYEHYQPCRAEVERRREIRRDAGARGGRRSVEVREAKRQAHAKQVASGLLRQNEANASHTYEANGEAKLNPVPVPGTYTHTRATGKPLIDRPLDWHKAHREHAFCGERVCVPTFLHLEFLRNLGGHPDDERVWLAGFYAEIDAALQVGQTAVGDVLKFLRGEFSSAVKKRSRPNPSAHIPEWFECAVCGGAHQGKRGDPCPEEEDVMAPQAAARKLGGV